MDLLKAIDRVAEILETSDIKEIRVKDGGSSIFMTKNSATNVITNSVAPTIATAPVVSSEVSSTNNTTVSTPKTESKEEAVIGEEIKSPMVGTFYKSPSPDAPAYVKESQEVKAGDTLCIIEAMKIMNKIEAEKDGKIVKILVEDGSAVQFDQPLFIID